MSELRQRKVSTPVEKAKNDARAAMEARVQARLSGKKGKKPKAIARFFGWPK